MKKNQIVFVIVIILIILSGIIVSVTKNNKDSAFNKSVPIVLYKIPEAEKVFVNGVIVPEKIKNIYSTKFYVKGNVSERDQFKLKKNQQVEILIFATNKIVTGKVESVGNSPTASDVVVGTQATTSSNSDISYYDANISLDSQSNIVNGFHVQATVALNENELKIPKSSIFEEAGKQYVFKVVNKKLLKQVITYKDAATPQVVVLSGLSEDDSIAATTKDMKEGISVE